jgi:hypothetical protein
VAEGFDIDIAAGTVEADGRDLRLAGFQEHPVGAGGCGARFQGSQHHPSKALARTSSRTNIRLISAGRCATRGTPGRRNRQPPWQRLDRQGSQPETHQLED